MQVGVLPYTYYCQDDSYFGKRKYSALETAESSPPRLKKQALSRSSGFKKSNDLSELFFNRPTYIALLFTFSYKNCEIVFTATLVFPKFLSPLNSIKFP